MKREDVKKILPTVTDEQLTALMDLAGQDAEKVKAKVTALEAERDTAKKDLDTLSKQLDEARKNNASAADIQKAFDAFKATVDAEKKKAAEEREAAERSAKIAERFKAVVGEKKFSHDAIRDAYLRKFGEALGSKDYEGKSDTEILHALTKDDAAAFKTTETIRLEGGANKGSAGPDDDAKIRSIMGLPPLKNGKE